MIRFSSIAELIFVALAFSSCSIIKSSNEALVTESRYVMGTILEIQMCKDEQARKRIEIAFSIAEELDRLLSNYNEASKLSQINKLAFKEAVHIDHEITEFLETALDLNEESNNTFDITVGPLVALWEEAAKNKKLPSKESEDKARNSVGSDFVKLDKSNKTVRLLKEGMILDSGGIGKGFAVDRIVRFLRSDNTKCALVNFGHSSIYALGTPPDAPAWRMMIKFPEEDQIGEIEIKDQALSASYSLGRSFEIEGKKYGRIINPSTGQPVSDRIQSVVLTDSATIAEALSKAVILSNDMSSIAVNSNERFEYLKKIGDEKPQISINFPTPIN